MKALRTLAAIAFFTCFSVTLFAQCGVDARFRFSPYISSNAYAFKFKDTSFIHTNWQVISRLWTFGDGGTATTIDPVHQYTKPGDYKVCLVECAGIPGTNDYCCDTSCETISICKGYVVANFSFTHTGNIFVFKATGSSSNYPPLKFSWSFQGGTPSISDGDMVTVEYPHAGTYQVCLKVMDSHGCYAYSCQNITVGTAISPCDGVKASFKYEHNSNIKNTLTLLAAQQKTGTLYQWSMDGVVLTNANPNTSYTVTNISSGYHKFCLTVFGTSANGTLIPCDDSCQYVNFTGNCDVNAEWTWTRTSIGGIYFSSVANPLGVVHSWTFGDGHGSDMANPVHNYAASGEYKVCHIVYLPGSSCRDTFCNVVKTIANTGCKAYFNWTTTTGNISSAAFTNHSSAAAGDAIKSYEWHFGDNSPASGDVNPVHTYATAGKYYVCLDITTAGGCKSRYCDSVKISTSTPYCKSYYTWKLTPGTMNVVFTSQPSVPSGDEVVSYYWSFGDNTSDPVLTHKSTEHTYANAGKYYACLKIITKNGCLSYFCDTIKVGTLHADCRSYFKWSGTNANGTVNFYDASTVGTGDQIVKYSWEFGDNSSPSGDKNPVHTYSVLGKYKVCLFVTSKNGCTSNYCDTVKVGVPIGNCHAEFKFGFQGCNTVNFENVSTGDYTSTEWIFGDGATSTDKNTHHTYNSPGTYTVKLIIKNSLTNCVSYVYHVITVQPCENDTICGFVFNDTNGNGIKDPGETPVVGAEVNISTGNNVNTFKTDADGNYYAIVHAGDHKIYVTALPGCLFTLPSGQNLPGTVAGTYYIPAGKANNRCGYNFGINCHIANICGLVYYDANSNGSKDAGEGGVANVVVTLVDGNGKEYQAYTNQNGEYCIKLPVGIYVIKIGKTVYPNCVSNPPSITLNASDAGKFYGHNDFGIKCQHTSCDLKFTITPNVSVSPGFPTWYTVFVCNIGTAATNAVVNFHYDEVLEFNYSNPPQTTADASTRVITWNIPGISPGDCKYFVVNFTTKKSAVIGSKVVVYGAVTAGSSCNDADLSNNKDIAYKEVTGSWDPNNKIAYRTNYEADTKYQVVASVNANQRIEYVINFQNSGNAPAFNVVIEDTLSDDLDIESFEFIGASHPNVNVDRIGNAVRFSFEEIMLPAESVDEPNSHGFVKFAINSKDGLVPSHIIADDAAIYFDYNQAVITNDAAVIMLDPTGIDKIISSATVLITPNPMSDHVRIVLNGSKTEGFQLKVMDISGRIISEQTSLSNTLNLNRNNLSAGMYIYEVIQNNQPVARGKMIVQ